MKLYRLVRLLDNVAFRHDRENRGSSSCHDFFNSPRVVALIESVERVDNVSFKFPTEKILVGHPVLFP